MNVKKAVDDTIEETIVDLKKFFPYPNALWPAVRGSLHASVVIGRLSVLEDFDRMCIADGYVGFTSDEWKAVQKFFAHNKQITGWDKDQEYDQS